MKINSNYLDIDLPVGLAKIANGRDLISTHETAFAFGIVPQTLRKHLCTKGSFHGVKPIKIGERWHFSVRDLALLMRGELHK
ncbi:hypothetical protein DCO17_05005 [Polynucleobacter tropicus]|uniref:DNA-binding protein n=1 Tax=Polynucleobacter tropicus TaxID=1743174 RepID=A0A6M9PVB7_9BURK|nr:hypothetical protein [Polynucleobacter tropicus]QKM64649.1 hypothetical protein DCO17_05005 [Polynucleobacter tropicus]